MALKLDKVLKLLNHLYSLAESGNYWGRMFRHHLKSKLQMKTLVSNPSFRFMKHENILTGLCATHVDDTLHIGNAAYCKDCQATENAFKWKYREQHITKLAGLKIKTTEGRNKINYKQYILKLSKMSFKF